MSLKSQIENLQPGESFITDKTRTGIYVAAKRAGVEISTEVVEADIKVTRKTTYEKMVEAITLVDQIAALPTKDRLELFERFELCCGMNRGECVCVPVGDLTSMVLPLPPVVSFDIGYREESSLDVGNALLPNRQGKLEALREMMANPKAEAEPEPVVEDWRFTKDAPQFADDGNVYRKQVLAPAGKKFRTVRVDESDLEAII